ncbi:hypothetical protein ACRHK7_00285 [Weissella tructae]|uniref:hypothetical protein n=1 Tax=Weissella tructae TaxID=887702 RepID=UPI003D936B5A
MTTQTNNVVEMPRVDVEFEVSHLPVTVGDVHMKFIDTPEAFAKLEAISKDPEGYAKNAIGDMNEEFEEAQKAVESKNASFEDLGRMLALQKKAYGVIMDEIFFPGDFDRLYERYPDLTKIMALMPTIMKLVGEASGRNIAMRDDQFKKQAKALLRKKNNKGKKKRK